MARGSIFSTVGGAKPKRSAFDLSYGVKTTMDFAKLYPVMCDEVVPGDIFKIGCGSVVRINPLFAPIMHEVNISVHYFFVAYRLLWEWWEQFITGGIDGLDSHVLPKMPFPDVSKLPLDPATSQPTFGTTLWDYLFFPADINPSVYSPNTSLRPIGFPYAAYDFILYEYYRDENLQNAIKTPSLWPEQVDDNNKPLSRWESKKFWEKYGTGNEDISTHIRYADYSLFTRSWKKDYFTSAQLDRQRGIAPSFPLTGSAMFPTTDLPLTNLADSMYQLGTSAPVNIARGNQRYEGAMSAFWTEGGMTSGQGYIVPREDTMVNGNNNGITQTVAQIGAIVPNVPIDLANVGTFNVSELRENIQFQKWMERAQRGGVRYTEWLRAMYGVSPRDERLQRPEYIGGMSKPLIVSEVLQTSETNNPTPTSGSALGDFGGHGISVGGDYAGTYRATEFGLIMGLMSIMPKPCYEDGLNRQWIKEDKFDFYNPLFAHLSEQGVYNAEIRYNATQTSADTDRDIFGYQGIFNEMRFKPDMVTGIMRQSYGANLAFWHMGRHFPLATVPTLSHEFLSTGFNEATGAKRVLAVPSEPAFIVNHRNHITAIRPMPYDPEPGFVDHF